MNGYDFPPSPALSDCDSLDGIDLDAYLAAKGPLSIFPTPQMSTDDQASPPALTRDNSISSALSIPDKNYNDAYVIEAELFVDLANNIGCQSLQYVEEVEGILRHASLPVEVLAIAHSLLDSLMHARRPHVWQSTGSLLLISTLALAELQITDTPRTTKSWLKLDRSGISTADEVNRIKMQIFECLDWSLHKHCDSGSVARFEALVAARSQQYACEPLPPLCTSLSTTVAWQYGQLTPAEHSPCPRTQQPLLTTYFLPLL